MWERSTDDRYGDPGRFEVTRGPFGDNVLLTSKDGRFAYLTGAGSSPDGDRPFLNKYELATGKTTQLFRSEAPYYENVTTMLDADGNRIVTLRESVNEVPNYFIRDIATNKLTQLTHAKDPAPEFAGVTKEFVKYKRADGVDLTATVYLPAGYDKAKDGPLPFFLWAYPAEFESVAAASQVARVTVPLHAALRRVAPHDADAGLRRDGQPDHPDHRAERRQAQRHVRRSSSWPARRRRSTRSSTWAWPTATASPWAATRTARS